MEIVELFSPFYLKNHSINFNKVHERIIAFNSNFDKLQFFFFFFYFVEGTKQTEF